MGELVDDGEIHVSPQKSVNQRPMMALLSLSLDMWSFPHFKAMATTLGGEQFGELQFLPW